MTLLDDGEQAMWLRAEWADDAGRPPPAPVDRSAVTAPMRTEAADDPVDSPGFVEIRQRTYVCDTAELPRGPSHPRALPY